MNRKVALLGVLALYFIISVESNHDVTPRCRVDKDCTSTKNPAFVQCLNGKCACKSEFGFVGKAAPVSQCKCPYKVHWKGDDAFCLDCNKVLYTPNGRPQCVDAYFVEKAENKRIEAQTAVIKELYGSLIYPKPIAYLMDHTLLNSMFANESHGRITPLGEYPNNEGALEYFYGFTANPTVYIYNTHITSLVSQGNKVAVQVDIMFNGTGLPLYNLTQVGFYFFNDDAKIISYDLNILRLGKWGDPVTDPSMTIPGVCYAATTFCTGANQQYESMEACIGFLSSIQFGSYYDAQANNVICRAVHSLLLPIRPDYHCPHVGPTGGMKCVDHPYTDYYTKDYTR